MNFTTQNYIQIDLYNYIEIEDPDIRREFKDIRFLIYYAFILLLISCIYRSFNVDTTPFCFSIFSKQYLFFLLSTILIFLSRSGRIQSYILILIYCRLWVFKFGNREPFNVYCTRNAKRHYSFMISFVGAFLSLFFIISFFKFAWTGFKLGEVPINMTPWKQVWTSLYCWSFFSSIKENKDKLMQIFGQ